MLTSRHSLIRRVAATLDAGPSRIPVLVGQSGTGRSTLLRQLQDRGGRSAAVYIDAERTATTPERFLQTVASAVPFPWNEPAPPGARAAFDRTLALFNRTQPN